MITMSLFMLENSEDGSDTTDDDDDDASLSSRFISNNGN